MKTKFFMFVALVVFIVGGFGVYMGNNNSGSGIGKLDSFAQCLKTSGAEYYGAFWCPNCQNQNKLFGSSKKYLPYTECSTPDGKGQLQICKDKEIKGYPLWMFADGTQASGLQSLQQLSDKTQCPLPQ